MTDQSETVINELYDVTVDTLGLVTRGANREEFFLLKSLTTEGESEQPREIPPTEAGQPDKQKAQDSFGKRFKTVLRSIIKQEMKHEFDAIAENINANYATILPSLATDAATISAEATAKADTELTAVEVTGEQPGSSTETLEVTEPSEPADSGLSKQENIEMDTVDIEKAELKNKLAEMEVRLAKAEETAAIEKEARDRQIYIAKADTMPALPVTKSELADHLYWLSKTDARRAQWFESALTATNNMLADSALLKEFGTRKVVDNGGMIEKAQAMVNAGKATDLADALLKMPIAEAAVYVAKRQSETGAR